MSALLQDVNNPKSVTQAIENNVAEFLLAMGRAGGGEERRTEKIAWSIGGSPLDYHNAVVHANLSAQETDAAIREVAERFKAHQVPGSWHLSPSMQPQDLSQRLEAQGFINGGDEPGMAAFLPALNEHIATPDGFLINRVRDTETLARWAATLAVGFGEGEREANWVAYIYRQIGLGDDVPWRHYLGWLNNQPVATASMYLGAGVAGIYFVFTVPQARRQGIGAAITVAALRDARDMGYQVGVLGSSESGFPVYERVGFRQYCNFMIYEWHQQP
jgi:GNAT superfamily N-acetyltransferase